MDFSTLTILANQPRLKHAVFKRGGGVSKHPFDSGNISFGVGDSPKDVASNRQKIKQKLGLTTLISARQVHGDQVMVISQPPQKDAEQGGFDALITNIAGVGLMIQQADCQAVMLFDPLNGVIANIHAGWRGSTIGIIKKTIHKMNSEFGTEAADLLAGISPSLGPCCAEFVNYKTELPEDFHPYQVRNYYFDFWAISRDQLTQAGVKQENIEAANICTVCDHDYFSYRRDKTTGRFSSVIALQ